MAQKPSITLNNLLQKKGQDHLLSWMETLKNTANATQWTMTCKFNGEVIGEATAPQKAEAKESASEKALATLSGRA